MFWKWLCTTKRNMWCNEYALNKKLKLTKLKNTKIELNLTPTIEECAIDKIVAAGQEEKRLAIMNGDIDKDGIPLIAEVADGSWAKRSYKIGFSSASGAACIVGLKTKKVC